MATTQELQVAALANNLISFAAQAISLQQQIDVASAAWTNLSAATKLNAFNTAAGTTTGGLGTADGSPVDTDPIDTRTAPGSELNRAISATNIAGILTGLQGISSVIKGNAVSANGAWPQLAALCL